MKKYWILAVAVATAFLTSCGGTLIEMTETVPAKVNIGRNTALSIVAPYSNYGLKSAFESKITEDGFYVLPGQASKGSATLSLENIERGYLYGAPYLAADVRILKNGQTLYKKGYIGTAFRDNQGKIQYGGASRTIARTVMNDLTPREKAYSVLVDDARENPYVKQGAEACKVGNWAQGKAYALQALKTNPQEAEAYFLLGVIERNELNYSQSTQYFRKADAIKPSGKYKRYISENKGMEQNDNAVQAQLQS